MNKEFLRKRLWQGEYILKQGTNTSYLLKPYVGIEALQDRQEKTAATLKLIQGAQAAGDEILLPLRVCFITGEDSAPVIHSGRGLKPKVAQMKASFTKIEQSPYKIAKPYKVCTSVWQMEGSRCLFYGTIGITHKEGLPPADNGDLVLFYTSNWKEVGIYIFKGLAKPNSIANLDEAGAFVLASISER